MHRHLFTPDALLADTCVLGKEEARHLQTVLRVKPGDTIQLFDGQGHTRTTTVTVVEKNSLTLTAVEPVVSHPQAPCAITLFVCISKGKHMDWTLEKAVELGVARIVPVISDRTIVRIDADDREAKADRWMRIAEEAARQSGRAWLPEILTPRSFKESLSLVQQTTPTFVAALTPNAKPLRDFLLPPPSSLLPATSSLLPPPSSLQPPPSSLLPPPSQAGWFVGPEGDFTPDELQRLLDAGAVPVSLGPLVLRAETACLYGLCALNCAWM
jgi:16S rRNA (uracil1498-N3)-methyltransferase